MAQIGSASPSTRWLRWEGCALTQPVHGVSAEIIIDRTGNVQLSWCHAEIAKRHQEQRCQRDAGKANAWRYRELAERQAYVDEVRRPMNATKNGVTSVKCFGLAVQT